ncbi:putative transport protein particle component Bet3 domain-containing protein [Neospora caninum Liverpool]|uniref:Putative transport protein particle component Bet3 domain-containing protein n=1 Tax=Neospora caninum (strain Liverpool) TaxID=572307 RepID=F0V823_NEOCL|nr:putative transport protein particle component Bet3 domain-containing protein [Neospora caninum Liverpool]CBZ49864.1 putative transport protein particle component Bet3 domain-containing protein [Neospora caninum Liverpool]CEL64453.1 TPA: transport protein particle component Bet3 domain-containing protein, putative [Neospora caninum Liverpool]|eukprot:XP_003879899.1 putative transport protein particle component Bet3 domain-containing protein [Neospora caninum Liverpool]
MLSSGGGLHPGFLSVPSSASSSATSGPSSTSNFFSHAASPAVLSPPVHEVATSGVHFLQQEVASYAALRSGGNRRETLATLEAAGFQIGVRLLERLSLRLQTRMWEQRECLKFVCKDLWQILFQKQADRLQTNRRGGYVIQDHSLPWLRRLRPAVPGENAKLPTEAFAGAYTATGSEREDREGENRTRENARKESEAAAKLQAEGAVAALCEEPLVHVSLVCGIIRGALANMGLSCTVTADASASPNCSFQIRIPS